MRAWYIGCASAFQADEGSPSLPARSSLMPRRLVVRRKTLNLALGVRFSPGLPIMRV
jgi:hypothetical protein